MGVNLFRNPTNTVQAPENYVFDSAVNATAFTQYQNGIVKASMFSFNSTIKYPNFNMRFDFLRNDFPGVGYAFCLMPFYTDLQGNLRVAGTMPSYSKQYQMYYGGATDVGLIPSVLMNFNTRFQTASSLASEGQSSIHSGSTTGVDGQAYTAIPSQQFLDSFSSGVQNVPSPNAFQYRKYAQNLDSAFIARDIVWKGVVFTDLAGVSFQGKIDVNVMYLPT